MVARAVAGDCLYAPALDEKEAEAYREEQAIIEAFVEGLPQCARLMAHVPSLLIFDDHDVTDDWNLTADWERCAYGHPFSKRIIGNALVAYLLCQGWGNAPDKLNPLLHQAITLFDDVGPLNLGAQDALIERLLRFQGWEFQVPARPHSSCWTPVRAAGAASAAPTARQA